MRQLILRIGRKIADTWTKIKIFLFEGQFLKFVKRKKKDDYILERYEPDISVGLVTDQINERITHELTNSVRDATNKSYLQIVFNNIFTFYNVLMISIALMLVIIVGPKVILDLGFMMILCSNLLIGLIQECKSKSVIDKLKLINQAKVNVIRNGETIEVLPTEILLDDIIELKIGDQIPADCIILSDTTIDVNESMLTGESVPVKKTKGDIILAGSYIVSGLAKVRADKIGADTYLYSIESKAKKLTKTKSKLMTDIGNIIKTFSLVAIPLALFVFWNVYVSGGATYEAYQSGVLFGGVTITYMIPAGLLLCTSVAMATGVVKMASKKTLMQDLSSIEALSRIDTLCLDKTGTLTDGTMVVDNVVQIAKMDYKLDAIIASYIRAFDTNNMTSKALLDKYNIAATFEIEDKVEFSSERKFSIVKFRTGDIYVLGAPEYLTADKKILNICKNNAKCGMRVLLFAKVTSMNFDDIKKKNNEEIALFMIRDNIRSEVKATMKWFRENDVDIKVISGDNPDTVSYIAKQAGIENWDRCVDMSTVDPKDLEHIVMQTTIFGRTSPEQKAEIIDILKRNGRTVGMSGDGINDIISLKKADCSIALANGAPATKNISNIVLMDSDFSNMKHAVLEGRRIINNIQRSSTLFIMKDFCWLFISLLPLLLGTNHVIEPTVMSITNITMTGIGSLLLAFEPDSSRIKGNFVKNVIVQAFSAGFFMALPVLLVYIYSFAKVGVDAAAVSLYIKENLIPVIAICISVSSLIILFNLCKPFTKYRKKIFVIILALVILFLFAIPELFVLNGTEYMDGIIKDGQTVQGVVVAIFKSFFTFNVYKNFTGSQWGILIGFVSCSVILYYICDIAISKLLEKSKIININQ